MDIFYNTLQTVCLGVGLAYQRRLQLDRINEGSGILRPTQTNVLLHSLDVTGFQLVSLGLTWTHLKPRGSHCLSLSQLEAPGLTTLVLATLN